MPRYVWIDGAGVVQEGTATLGSVEDAEKVALQHARRLKRPIFVYEQNVPLKEGDPDGLELVRIAVPPPRMRS